MRRYTTVLAPAEWQSREHAGVSYNRQAKQATFGGWYQHTIVMLHGVEIGRLQHKRRNKREEHHTTRDAKHGGGCVRGIDVMWLVRSARIGA